METDSMNRRMSQLSLAGLLLLALGCKDNTPTPAPGAADARPETSADHDEHVHGAGPHGGTLAEWGGGALHAEFTVDHDAKEATVYMLGSDAKTPAPIKASAIALSINNPATDIELAAKPMEGETEGKSSRFVGQHDTIGIVQEFAGTISGEVDGTPYVGEFAEAADED
jgi:hypothetical protein